MGFEEAGLPKGQVKKCPVDPFHHTWRDFIEIP